MNLDVFGTPSALLGVAASDQEEAALRPLVGQFGFGLSRHLPGADELVESLQTRIWGWAGVKGPVGGGPRGVGGGVAFGSRVRVALVL